MTTENLRVNRSNLLDTRIAAAIFFFFVIFTGMLWLRVDQAVWPFDPAWYGEVSLKLYATIRDAPAEWWPGMMQAFGFKAPLLAWLGQFFALLQPLTGNYEDALMIVPLLASALSVVVVMITASRIFENSAGPAIAAGLSMTAASLFVGLSREYFVEPLQLLSVALFFLLATLRPEGIALLLLTLSVAAFGMLSKVSTPLYVVFPAMIICFDIIRNIRQGVSQQKFLWLGIPAAALLMLCIGWYGTNWNQLITFIKHTSSGDIALLYGSQESFVPKLGFWTGMLGASFFNSMIGVYVWLPLLLIALLVRVLRGKPLSRGDLLICCAFGEVVLVIACFANQVNEETRYLLPLLPAVALTIAFIVNEIRIFFAPVTCALLIQTAVVAFASTSGSTPYLSFSPWLHQPQADASQRTLLHEAVSETCNQALNGRYTIIGHEVGVFNANSASFYMAQNIADTRGNPACYYTSLGYAEKNDERSWNRIREMNAAFVVFREDLKGSPHDPFNAVSESIRSRVASSNEFIKVEEAEFPLLQIYRHLP